VVQLELKVSKELAVQAVFLDHKVRAVLMVYKVHKAQVDRRVI
jgi:hypothetical protein